MSDDFRDRVAALRAQLENLRDIQQRFVEVVEECQRGIDKVLIAEHPDLGTLGHELDNLYGQSFD